MRNKSREEKIQGRFLIGPDEEEPRHAHAIFININK